MESPVQTGPWVRIVWCSLSGLYKCKMVSASSFHGGVSIPSVDSALPFTQDVPAFAPHESGDVLLVPELASLRALPFCPGHSRVFAVARDQAGSPWTLDARTWLRGLAADLRHVYGLAASLSLVQHSFYLLRGSDSAGWHPADASSFASVDAVQRSAAVLSDIAAALEQQGLPVESVWAETGAGQFALRLRETPEDCVLACDAHMIVKETVRAVAGKAGLKATFVPKLSSASPGSGVALRLGLRESTEEKGKEKEAVAEKGMAGKFFAGVLDHMPSLTAVGLATANSWYRSTPLPHAWTDDASVASAAMRLKKNAMEMPLCDGTTNLYLLMGCIIVAGLDGIVTDKILPPALKEVAEGEKPVSLPADFSSALNLFEKDGCFENAMGELRTGYLAVKRAELEVKTTLPVMLERF